MKKYTIILIILIFLVGGYLVWSNRYTEPDKPNDPQVDTSLQDLEGKIRTAVEAVLLKGKTANPANTIPSGSKLLDVSVTGLEKPGESTPKVTLNFNKEVFSKGDATFEDIMQYVFNAVHPFIQGEGPNPRYPEMGFIVLIEGKDPYVQEMTTIKTPLISIGGGTSGDKFGCDDKIVYINKSISKTTMPLSAAYRELFALRTEQVEGYYNVIARLQNKEPAFGEPLAFDKAVVENGAAKIYLTGDFGGLGGVCDDPRPRAQLEAVVKQFSTVKSVEIYLNGNLWAGIPGASGLNPTLTQSNAYILTRNAWGDCTIYDECEKMTVTTSKQGETWYVAAIYEGLHDDSIAAIKKVAPAYYADSTWKLGTAVMTQKCQSGRGHQDFSSELCV